MATKPSGDRSWIEPDSTADKSKYPFNQVMQTESGHSVELDDTPGAERIRLQHRIGNYTEIQATGDEIHKVIGDHYEIVVKNNHVKIKGYCMVTIEGDSLLEVNGDVVQRINGRVEQKVDGDVFQVVDGDIDITSKSDININATGLAGSVTLSASDTVKVNGDLYVDGSINSTGPIHSNQNIMADKKMYAEQGMLTLGLQVGVPDRPGPLPAGVILASSAVMVPTGLVSGMIVKDMTGTLELLRMAYMVHTHGTSVGPTTPPAGK